MKKLILLFCVLFHVNLYSQWSTNPNVNNPVCRSVNDQNASEIISDGKGGVIITWADERSSSLNSDIYAQRFNADGVRKWALNGISVCAAVKRQYEPDIASDGNGGAIIIWQDERGAFTDLYAQRIDSNGNAVWQTNGVPVCTVNRYQKIPQIISDGNGGIFAVWEDTRNLLFSDIYAQHLNANGSPLWNPDGLEICVLNGQQNLPEAVSDGNGGIIVAWNDSRYSNNTNIYAQRINAAGNILWQANGTPVCDILKAQNFTGIISDGNGGAIISFTDSRNAAVSNIDIYAQRIGPDGSQLWQNGGIAICTATNQQDESVLCSDGSGGAIIAWHDLRKGGDYDGDIYAQHITKNGVLTWTADGALAATAFRYRLFPYIVTNNKGGAVIIWQDYRGPGGSGYIYAQQMNAQGMRLWGAGGVAVCTAANGRFISGIVNDATASAVGTRRREAIRLSARIRSSARSTGLVR